MYFLHKLKVCILQSAAVAQAAHTAAITTAWAHILFHMKFSWKRWELAVRLANLLFTAWRLNTDHLGTWLWNWMKVTAVMVKLSYSSSSYGKLLTEHMVISGAPPTAAKGKSCRSQLRESVHFLPQLLSRVYEICYMHSSSSISFLAHIIWNPLACCITT